MMTPNLELNLKNKEFIFEIISNQNNKFNIHLLNKGNTLAISSFCKKNEINTINYESNFELSYIKEVKLFTLYDTLDECLDEIFSGINTGKSSLIEKEKSISLIIPLNNIKYKEIKFDIKIKEKNDKEKISELYDIIGKQNIEINNLKNEISELKQNVQDLLNFKKKIEEKAKEREKEMNCIDSKILQSNENYKKILKEWINPNKEIKTELLYRLSRDGDSMETFYSMCSDASPKIILTKSKDEHIFGAYTTLKFKKGECKNLIDNETFLFSLSKNQKFKKKNESKNKRDFYSSKSGLNFGGGDFWFTNNTMKSYYSNKSYYFLPKNYLPSVVELKELEVFKII